MNARKTLLVDYDNRFIWLDGEITAGIAKRFAHMLRKLNRLKCSMIIFYIRGIGGDFHPALDMMNAITASDSPVAIVAHDFVNSGCFLITQAGHHRLALAGTKFGFHRSVWNFKQNIDLGRHELLEFVERGRVLDTIQLSWFFRKAQSVEEVFNLFDDEARIGLKKAKDLGLIDDYYKKEDFLKDKKVVNRMLRAIK